MYVEPARGGGQSTARDMLAFDLALQHRKTARGGGTAAILGSGIGGAGGFAGINAELDIDPASGYILVTILG